MGFVRFTPGHCSGGLCLPTNKSSKHQHPSPRETSNTKFQSTGKNWMLKFEISLDVGAWNLELMPMRITGGNAARRILKVPKGLDVRPTPDLVKQAVFNSLGARVVGAKVLELFAGSGTLSLECLSRGAEAVMCVEKSHRHE